MAIHDRDYYQPTRFGDNGPLAQRILRSAVWTILVLNVIVYLLQIFLKGAGEKGFVTEWFAGNSEAVFGSFQIWRLLTANFLHDPNDLFHLAMNMFVLFLFGRELERIYGRTDFYFLYLLAGCFAIFAELVVHQITGIPHVEILGASGAVLGIVVVYTLFYPNRTILLFFVIPTPMWVLCVFYIVYNILGALGRETNVAHVAHLGGALIGYLYRRYDLRWTRLRGYLPRVAMSTPHRKKRSSHSGKVIPFPQSSTSPEPPSEEVTAISKRIDDLLHKISTEGKDSLSDEEWQFLRENSERYRSPSG